MIAKDAANQGSASPLSKQMLTPGKKPEERSQELLLANFEKTDDELKHLIFTPEDHQDEFVGNLQKTTKRDLEKLEHNRSPVQKKKPTNPRPWMDQYTPKMNKNIKVADFTWKEYREQKLKEKQNRENALKAMLLEEKEIEKQRRNKLRILDLLNQYHKVKKDIEELEFLKLTVPNEKLIVLQSIYFELAKDGIDPFREELLQDEEDGQSEKRAIAKADKLAKQLARELAQEQAQDRKYKKTAAQTLLNIQEGKDQPSVTFLTAQDHNKDIDDLPENDFQYAENVYLQKIQQMIEDQAEERTLPRDQSQQDNDVVVSGHVI